MSVVSTSEPIRPPSSPGQRPTEPPQPRRRRKREPEPRQRDEDEPEEDAPEPGEPKPPRGTQVDVRV